MFGDQIYINVPFPDQRGKCPYTLIHFAVFILKPDCSMTWLQRTGSGPPTQHWICQSCQVSDNNWQHRRVSVYILLAVHHLSASQLLVSNCTLSGMWEHSLETTYATWESIVTVFDCYVQLGLYFAKLQTATSPTIYNLPIKGLGQDVKTMLLSCYMFGMVHNSSPWLTSPLPSLYLTRSQLSLRHTQTCVCTCTLISPFHTHTHTCKHAHTVTPDLWPL